MMILQPHSQQLQRTETIVAPLETGTAASTSVEMTHPIASYPTKTRLRQQLKRQAAVAAIVLQSESMSTKKRNQP